MGEGGRRWLGVLGALGAMAGAVTPAPAHHSFAMFDAGRTVDLAGVVREFQWTNPHCFIQLVVPGGSGQPAEWSVEMLAPAQLRRAGWKPTTLKPGDKVTLKIRPLRSEAPGGSFVLVTFADGGTMK